MLGRTRGRSMSRCSQGKVTAFGVRPHQPTKPPSGRRWTVACCIIVAIVNGGMHFRNATRAFIELGVREHWTQRKHDPLSSPHSSV